MVGASITEPTARDQPSDRTCLAVIVKDDVAWLNPPNQGVAWAAIADRVPLRTVQVGADVRTIRDLEPKALARLTGPPRIHTRRFRRGVGMRAPRQADSGGVVETRTAPGTRSRTAPTNELRWPRDGTLISTSPSSYKRFSPDSTHSIGTARPIGRSRVLLRRLRRGRPGGSCLVVRLSSRALCRLATLEALASLRLAAHRVHLRLGLEKQLRGGYRGVHRPRHHSA